MTLIIWTSISCKSTPVQSTWPFLNISHPIVSQLKSLNHLQLYKQDYVCIFECSEFEQTHIHFLSHTHTKQMQLLYNPTLGSNRNGASLSHDDLFSPLAPGKGLQVAPWTSFERFFFIALQMYIPSLDVLLFGANPCPGYTVQDKTVFLLSLFSLLPPQLSSSSPFPRLLSVLLSPPGFRCQRSTCYPMSWLAQRAEASSRSGFRAAGLHVASSPCQKRALNVLGVAVVTSLPHKLHQPESLR